MNLIEVVGVVCIVGMGVCGGWIGGAHGITGALLGALAGASVVPLLAAAAVNLEPTFTGRPYWPPCGDCGGDAYSHEWVDELGRSVARCACGARYVRRGRQCLRVTATGATRPHLRWRPLRGWIDESTPGPGTTAMPYRDPAPPAGRGSRRRLRGRG